MKYPIEPVIDFILAQQQADGAFLTYESYPVLKPNEGWTALPDYSPFITANVLYSLQQLNHPRLKAAVEKGIANLLTAKERNGLWRFWPLQSQQNPVPTDMDVTCVVSFVLTRAGYPLNNRSVLMACKNAAGYFDTWLANSGGLWFSHPIAAVGLLKDRIASLPTQKLQFLSFNDREPAVAANAVLYLGDNAQTRTCIDLMIQEIKANTMPLQFYMDEEVVYYHVARAFANGVKSFEAVRDIIVERICAKFAQPTYQANELVMLMAANTLLDFNKETALAEKLVNAVMAGRQYPDKWQNFAYFCSKDRNFLAGSQAFTAALFVEAAGKLNESKL